MSMGSAAARLCDTQRRHLAVSGQILLAAVGRILLATDIGILGSSHASASDRPGAA